MIRRAESQDTVVLLRAKATTARNIVGNQHHFVIEARQPLSQRERMRRVRRSGLESGRRGPIIENNHRLRHARLRQHC